MDGYNVHGPIIGYDDNRRPKYGYWKAFSEGGPEDRTNQSDFSPEEFDWIEQKLTDINNNRLVNSEARENLSKPSKELSYLMNMGKNTALPDSYFGYETRNPYPSEEDYFKLNPSVAGMASEDNRIIFNPFSTGINRQSVGTNEASRLWMRQNNLVPDFQVTPEQMNQFRGTPYENDPLSLKQTIVGRILSGDPSAGNVTPEQRQWADKILNQMNMGTGGAVNGAGIDPSWFRQDGTPKGQGYFGELPALGGKTSTELSIGVNLNGKEMDIPTLVPGLSPEEIRHLASGGEPTPDIVRKAVEHAKTRLSSGLDPFAGVGDQRPPPTQYPGQSMPMDSPDIPMNDEDIKAYLLNLGKTTATQPGLMPLYHPKGLKSMVTSP